LAGGDLEYILRSGKKIQTSPLLTGMVFKEYYSYE